MRWGQGRPKVAEISKTCPHFDVTPGNPPIKDEKHLFSISCRRLAESVDGLDSSLAQPAGELWSCEDLKSGVKKLARAGLQGLLF